MSNELTIAFIASIASIVVALVGLMASLISSRMSSRSEKAIEKLKFEFSRLSSKEQIIDTQLAGELEALQEALRSIQRVKDEAQLILSGLDTGLNAKDAKKRVVAAREAIFACYEKQFAVMSDSENDVFHRAKNIAFNIENYTKSGLQQDHDISELPDHHRQRLESLRHELTEIQGILRDSRTERLLRRIANESRNSP